jgi:hypothetical protein
MIYLAKRTKYEHRQGERGAAARQSFLIIRRLQVGKTTPSVLAFYYRQLRSTPLSQGAHGPIDVLVQSVPYTAVGSIADLYQ